MTKYQIRKAHGAAKRASSELANRNWVDDACPGCGCRPGDGVTKTCNHPDGCGFWKEEGKIHAK